MSVKNIKYLKIIIITLYYPLAPSQTGQTTHSMYMIYKQVRDMLSFYRHTYYQFWRT